MSQNYDRYLSIHKMNVLAGYYWIEDNLPEIISKYHNPIELNDQMRAHDASKFDRDEYHAYDAYFYGGNKSYAVVEEFNKAWLRHIHLNPHHWQHWILVHDDPVVDTVLEMPYNYIIEMICDWWSFSWSKDNLYEIFDWYEERKERIRINPNTRKIVEDILKQIHEKLEELDQDDAE